MKFNTLYITFLLFAVLVFAFSAVRNIRENVQLKKQILCMEKQGVFHNGVCINK